MMSGSSSKPQDGQRQQFVPDGVGGLDEALIDEILAQDAYEQQSPDE